MNWEALSASGDIISALAILVTLFYLAGQLRQNTRSVRPAALQTTMDRWQQWGQVLATTPDLADIVERGNADYEALGAAEARRFGAYWQMFFDAVESYHDQLREIGIRGDEAVLKAIVRRRIADPGVLRWWQDNHEDYSAAFVDWIERARGQGTSDDKG